MLLRALIAASLLPSIALAQVCLGNPSLSRVSVNLGGNAQFADGVSAFNASLTAGTDATFIGGTVGTASYEDEFKAATIAGGLIGRSLPSITESKKFQMCLVGTGDFGFGPTFIVENWFGEYEVEVKTRVLAGGLALGGAIEVNNELRVLPHIAFGLRSNWTELSGGGETFDVSETGGFIRGGASFLVNEILAIRTAVTVPLGFEESDPTFGIGFIIGLGRR